LGLLGELGWLSVVMREGRAGGLDYAARMASLEKLTGRVQLCLDPAPFGWTARLVREDGTEQPLEVTAVAVRAARRELSLWLLPQGYVPVGGWHDREGGASYRVYRPAG